MYSNVNIFVLTLYFREKMGAIILFMAWNNSQTVVQGLKLHVSIFNNNLITVLIIITVGQMTRLRISIDLYGGSRLQIKVAEYRKFTKSFIRWSIS